MYCIKILLFSFTHIVLTFRLGKVVDIILEKPRPELQQIEQKNLCQNIIVLYVLKLQYFFAYKAGCGKAQPFIWLYL